MQMSNTKQVYNQQITKKVKIGTPLHVLTNPQPSSGCSNIKNHTALLYGFFICRW